MRVGEPALLLGNQLASHLHSVVYLGIIPFRLSSPVQVCSPCQVLRWKCEQDSPASVSSPGTGPQRHRISLRPVQEGRWAYHSRNTELLSTTTHVTGKTHFVVLFVQSKGRSAEFGE